jgi:hypothetical protein
MGGNSSDHDGGCCVMEFGGSGAIGGRELGAALIIN